MIDALRIVSETCSEMYSLLYTLLLRFDVYALLLIIFIFAGIVRFVVLPFLGARFPVSVSSIFGSGSGSDSVDKKSIIHKK